MTCMAMGYELLLESASKVNNSKYLLGLSSLCALKEARVITGSCIRCSCSFGRVDVRVEDTSNRDIALLRVMMPKAPPLATKTFLFFALVMGIA
ncbi:hypothetical protein ACFX16_028221 [Malus domestica]